MQLLRTAFLGFATLSMAAASGNYTQHNLVSDVPGAADHTDAKLVNAWGLARSATSPWWVNSNGKGLSLVYDASGTPFPTASPIVVTIPAPGGGTSAPAGIVFNGTQDFQLATGAPAAFIFATEDGVIAGWNRTVSASTAVVKFDSKGGAIYKGLAIGQMSGANVLYAANFRSGLVEVFDRTFSPMSLSMGAFRDPQIPAGYAPFNVQNIGGNIAVMFAKQDGMDEVHGAGLGYVDIFTPAGVLMTRFHHGPWMNAPWGIALAPADFGRFGKKYLVGNFGSGQIAAFSESGEFQGVMRGRKGRALVIDGLWGLAFGNGGTAGPANILFFTAGPADEQHGLFGTLSAASDDADDDSGDNDGKGDNGGKGEGDGNVGGNGKGHGDRNRDDR